MSSNALSSKKIRLPCHYPGCSNTYSEASSRTRHHQNYHGALTRRAYYLLTSRARDIGTSAVQAPSRNPPFVVGSSAQSLSTYRPLPNDLQYRGIVDDAIDVRVAWQSTDYESKTRHQEADHTANFQTIETHLWYSEEPTPSVGQSSARRFYQGRGEGSLDDTDQDNSLKLPALCQDRREAQRKISLPSFQDWEKQNRTEWKCLPPDQPRSVFLLPNPRMLFWHLFNVLPATLNIISILFIFIRECHLGRTEAPFSWSVILWPRYSTAMHWNLKKRTLDASRIHTRTIHFSYKFYNKSLQGDAPSLEPAKYFCC